MVYYGRSSRARKSFGTKRRSTGGRYRRSSYGRKNVQRLRFATTGYARSVEKKYLDKTYISNSFEQATGAMLGGTQDSRGYTYISNAWGDYTFGQLNPGNAAVTSNDMLKGVETGTTARTRIGNKIKPVYLKGAFTFTAAEVNTGTVHPMNGESIVADTAGGPARNYLRTSFRFVIVKDMQVNSSDTVVTWPMVFDTTNQQAGVHSELNVNNMGRFRVLQDRNFTLTGDTPQKTMKFNLNGAKIGEVRYNGPSGNALTDRGVYVVWAAFVMGVPGITISTDINLPSPVGHSRLCFTDD